MSNKKIKTCPNCFRRKRNLFDFDGVKVCEECLDLKVFDKTIRDDLLKDSNVRKVAMEQGVFTERTPNLRVYLATMQAMQWLLTQNISGSNEVELDNLKKIVQGYAADLEKDVIPVLQKVDLLGNIKEIEKKVLDKKKKVKVIASGSMFNEVSKRWKGKQKDQALYLIHGLVSSGTLSETPYTSGIRDTFVNAIIDELVELSTGDIDETKGYYEIEGYNCLECGKHVLKHQKEILEDHLRNDHVIPEEDILKFIEPNQQLKGYLVPESQFEKYAKRKNMQTKSFIDKLYTFIRNKFIFYEEEPIIKREGETFWIIKPEWVRTLSKIKVNVKEYIKELGKEKEKSK